MAEFPKFENLRRREQQRIEAIQLVIRGLERTTLTFTQPEEGFGYLDKPDMTPVAPAVQEHHMGFNSRGDFDIEL